jgi:hypothetical protein
MNLVRRSFSVSMKTRSAWIMTGEFGWRSWPFGNQSPIVTHLTVRGFIIRLFFNSTGSHAYTSTSIYTRGRLCLGKQNPIVTHLTVRGNPLVGFCLPRHNLPLVYILVLVYALVIGFQKANFSSQILRS